ncbi:MAG: response regulator transcription factor [Microbacteriaceae bacterium]|nr:MAG: response regulator transcription factor [Microbacteriaceae bacterium]
MRVLLVEDDPAIADSVARGLNAEGFVTEIANNGIDGLWMAQEHPFDLAILDIMLPGLNGYEVCKRLRAAESGLPILMLTAKDGEYDEADALDLGADDFLSKPFSFVVLLARLRALLRRAPADREPVLTCGDLRLDPATKRCWRGDAEIGLTAREFALMEFLLHRKGLVVSRNTIATHVWDARLDVDSNVVEVYISYLRRKIDKPYGRNDIRTVRGLGYRLLDTPTE